MSKDDKNVPALRFKGFSDAWEKRKLGDLSTIRRGASPRPINSPEWFSDTSSVGWLRISDVTEQNGRIYSVAQHLSEKGQKKTLVLTKRHLILSIAATVGKPVQNYTALGIHDGFIVFMSPKFDLDFMFYFLEKYQPQWMRFGQPGSQVNLNSELVRNLEIRLPRRDEQEQVSKILLKLDNLIAATQQKIADLEIIAGYLAGNLLYRTLRFNNYSDPWEKKTLGDFVKTYSGGTPKANASEYYGGDIPFIRSAEIHQTETALTITKEGLETSSAKLVKRGDILYALYGANSGDVDRSKINGAINQAILAILPDENIDPDFLCFQLRKMKRHIVGTYLQGGQGNLSGKIVTSFLIDVPKSLSEQKRIGKNLSTLANLIVVTKNKLSELKSVKRSLLANLFI